MDPLAAVDDDADVSVQITLSLGSCCASYGKCACNLVLENIKSWCGREHAVSVVHYTLIYGVLRAFVNAATDEGRSLVEGNNIRGNDLLESASILPLLLSVMLVLL